MVERLGWKRAIAIAGFFEIGIRTCSAFHSVVSGNALPRYITASPFAYWLSWSLGAYAAKCYINNDPSVLSRLSLSFAACMAFALPLFRPTADFGFLAFALLTAAIVSRLVSGQIRVFTDNLLYRHLSQLGAVSFSFYLVHQPILYLTPRIAWATFPELLTHPLFMFSFQLFFYLPIFYISKLMFGYIEMPSVTLGKVLWRYLQNARLWPRGQDLRQCLGRNTDN